MIPHITKGGDMRGLVGYLCSTESRTDVRANQHEHPQVLGGEPFLATVYGGELTAENAAEIAAYLDVPRKAYQVKVQTRAWQQDGDGARVAVMDGGEQRWRDEHVWHCSLSLADGETLSADQWGRVAQEFADKMQLTEASGCAPARWVAIHHGAGKGGHDHLHIAASAVREDGTKVSFFRDFPRAQQVCRELEVEHGLYRVDGREHGTATRGVTAAEVGQHRTGDRAELANRVRAAAVASTSEAEWVRRVRADGMVVNPRFAPGTMDVTVGYRVALKSTPERHVDKLSFYSGTALGKDLSLPRLREAWPEPTIEQASEASAEWQAASQGKRTGVNGREAKTLDHWAPVAPDVAARNLQTFSDRLAAVPISDRIAWSDAARDVSGALSAWAKFDPTMAPELRTAAAVIAGTAQDRRPGGQVGRRVKESPMGTSMILLAAGRDDKGKLAGAVLMAQLLRAATAIRDYNQATGNARQAQAIQEAAIRPLSQLRPQGYQPDPAEMTPAERHAFRAREISNRMNGAPRAGGFTPPTVLTPRHRPTTQPPGRDHGRER